MIDIKNMISGRLKNQGLAPIEISRLIKDISNITGGEWYFTIAYVKYALEKLGWEKYLLDNYTLELIFLYLDDKAAKEFNEPVVH